MNFLAATLLLILKGSCIGFNVDTNFPVLYSGDNDSYFGYTVALHRNNRGPVALVGAPKANSTTVPGPDPIYEPGALFRCDIASDGTDEVCQEIAIMKEGNTFTWEKDEFSYKERKDGMWLGVSLDVRQSKTQNDTVVCGHLWRNQRYDQMHFVNGICYIIDTDLNEGSVRKLLPTVRRSMQYRTFYGGTEYYFAYGQAGMSAAFSEDSSNLILGAPGVFSWTGSFVSYSVSPGSMTAMYSSPVTPMPALEINYNSYFGYSVSSGRFFKSKVLLYAVGAPREAANHGMVYIVRPGGRQMNARLKKSGDQLGEYFGASVLAVDLNGDSFTDLLVGAPLNSMESAGDEGKVYVYISNEEDLVKYTEIAGERKPSARFGTAIANIRDINQDGYTDIAVGAPYEDGQGAVYIYHGTRFGLNSRYEQKIEASVIDRKLSGFGIHVSRGLDIDDNGYPDFLVGSYASSNAVLFRSRPVINVTSNLIFNPKQIIMNATCEGSFMNRICVQVDACLRYTGKHVPSSLEFRLTVLIQDQRRRGFFLEGASQSVKSGKSEVIKMETEECVPFTMFLDSGIKDMITPIQVQFSHVLKPPKYADDPFQATVPVYDPSSLTNITSRIAFQTGCGKEDECQSNLIVSAKRLDPPESTEFLTLGRVSIVSVEITVRNTGEPAYLSELRIFLPSEMSSINQDTCESGGQQSNATLICDLGNPLRNGTEVKIHIKLDATKIPSHTKYFQMVFEGITISTDTQPDDNVMILPLYFETIYDIGITGISFPDQIMYDESETLSTIVSNTYIVRNYGPSPLQTIHFSLHVPYNLSTPDGFKPLLSLSVETEKRNRFAIPFSCEDIPLNVKAVQTPVKQRGKTTDENKFTIEEEGRSVLNLSSGDTVGPPSDLQMAVSTDKNQEVNEPEKEKEDDTNTPKIRTIEISCESGNIQCIELKCSASSFSNPREYAEISVSLQMDFTVLNDYLSPWYHIELVTHSSISVKGSEIMKQNVHSDVAQVKIDILHKGPPPPEQMKSWIIFVSIGVGVFLLLLILIILLKIGFFRRKEKDQIKKMLCDDKKVEKKEDNVNIDEGDYCELDDDANLEETNA